MRRHPHHLARISERDCFRKLKECRLGIGKFEVYETRQLTPPSIPSLAIDASRGLRLCGRAPAPPPHAKRDEQHDRPPRAHGTRFLDRLPRHARRVLSLRGVAVAQQRSLLARATRLAFERCSCAREVAPPLRASTAVPCREDRPTQRQDRPAKFLFETSPRDELECRIPVAAALIEIDRQMTAAPASGARPNCWTSFIEEGACQWMELKVRRRAQQQPNIDAQRAQRLLERAWAEQRRASSRSRSGATAESRQPLLHVSIKPAEDLVGEELI